MRAAIYARVSTKDKGQDVENQLLQLRRYAASSGWEWIEFIDYQTGKHADRTKFKEMFVAATRREFQVVLVWALDRFTREGILETFEHVKKLRDYGVGFESLTEAQFRTTGPNGELMLAIAAWIAKQERLRISERTKAGLARVKAQGKQLGHKPKVFDIERAKKLRKAGLSWRAVERKLGIPQSTIRARLQGVQQT